jgi:hypothetical protein
MTQPIDLDFREVQNALRIEEGRAIIKRTQDIDDNFLSRLRDERLASQHAPMGDFHHVAEIPAVLVEKWLAEGFNIFDKNNTLADIIKRLQREDAEGCIATSKKLY